MSGKTDTNPEVRPQLPRVEDVDAIGHQAKGGQVTFDGEGSIGSGFTVSPAGEPVELVEVDLAIPELDFTAKTNVRAIAECEQETEAGIHLEVGCERGAVALLGVVGVERDDVEPAQRDVGGVEAGGADWANATAGANAAITMSDDAQCRRLVMNSLLWWTLKYFISVRVTCRPGRAGGSSTSASKSETRIGDSAINR